MIFRKTNKELKEHPCNFVLHNQWTINPLAMRLKNSVTDRTYH